MAIRHVGESGMNNKTTFFSVDVETSSVSPWNGVLLTVGIKPIMFEPGESPELLDSEFYVRIDQYQELLSIGWGEEEGAGYETYLWWKSQTKEAIDEAWADRSLSRVSAKDAALQISDWVSSIQPDHKKRIFVANPVSFDMMWLTELFDTTGIKNPFHYQTLCLRSMKFGLRKNSAWTYSRDNHDPEIPHHALHDAKAQAFDLMQMIGERDGI